MVKNSRQRQIRSSLIQSVVAHSLFFALMLLRQITGRIDQPYIPTLRVDLVALPDQTKQELEQIIPDESVAKEKPNPEPPEKVDPKEKQQKAPETSTQQNSIDPGKKADQKNRKDRMNRALNKLKALQSIKPKSPELSHPLLKGNEISQGTSALGEKSDAARYWEDSVVSRIRQNWDLPIWLKRLELRGRVQIEIERTGQLASLNWITRSGNDAFDSAVERSIRDSLPFPKSPSGSGALRIELGFPL